MTPKKSKAEPKGIPGSAYLEIYAKKESSSEHIRETIMAVICAPRTNLEGTILGNGPVYSREVYGVNHAELNDRFKSWMKFRTEVKTTVIGGVYVYELAKKDIQKVLKFVKRFYNLPKAINA
jgi:hypothetical protein